MTALSSDYRREHNICVKREELPPVKMAANAVGYVGSMVVGNTSGYGETAAAGANKIALGVAAEGYNNTGGANGAIKARVWRGQFWFANEATDPVVQADLYSNCYIFDDNTVCHTATSKSVAGKVLGLDSTLGVLVEIG